MFKEMGQWQEHKKMIIAGDVQNSKGMIWKMGWTNENGTKQ